MEELYDVDQFIYNPSNKPKLDSSNVLLGNFLTYFCLKKTSIFEFLEKIRKSKTPKTLFGYSTKGL